VALYIKKSQLILTYFITTLYINLSEVGFYVSIQLLAIYIYVTDHLYVTVICLFLRLSVLSFLFLTNMWST